MSNYIKHSTDPVDSNQYPEAGRLELLNIQDHIFWIDLITS